MISQEEAVERAVSLAARPGRAILGIAGAPGAGKSTLGAMVAQAVPGAVVVGMDGYHLADVELDRLGFRSRKGAVDTFDGWGYLALLRRLRLADEPVVYAPLFERDLGEPLAGAVPVPRDCPLVVTEGNYLLLAEQPWDQVPGLLDEVWFCDLSPEVRRDRLATRHQAFGKTASEAARWVAQVDEINTLGIEATRERADLVVLMR